MPLALLKIILLMNFSIEWIPLRISFESKVRYNQANLLPPLLKYLCLFFFFPLPGASIHALEVTKNQTFEVKEK